MAAHSSILAWRIPMDRGAWWAAVPGVGHDWATGLGWTDDSLYIPLFLDVHYFFIYLFFFSSFLPLHSQTLVKSLLLASYHQFEELAGAPPSHSPDSPQSSRALAPCPVTMFLIQSRHSPTSPDSCKSLWTVPFLSFLSRDVTMSFSHRETLVASYFLVNWLGLLLWLSKASSLWLLTFLPVDTCTTTLSLTPFAGFQKEHHLIKPLNSTCENCIFAAQMLLLTSVTYP